MLRTPRDRRVTKREPGHTATATLLAFRESARCGLGPISSLQVSYYLYLAELIGPVYGRWFPGFKFHRVNYAPQSMTVNAAVSFLAWHGMVVSETRTGDLQQLQITAFGRDAAEMIATTPYVRRLAELIHDLFEALRGLGAAELRDVCKLVFEEPAFERTLDVNPSRSDAPLPDLGDQHPSARILAAASFARSRIHAKQPGEAPADAPMTLATYLRLLAIRAQQAKVGPAPATAKGSS